MCQQQLNHWWKRLPVTWLYGSPENRTENQTDHISIARRFRRKLQDVRATREADAEADAASDHQLLLCKSETQANETHKQTAQILENA